jgi:hypothetical protein
MKEINLVEDFYIFNCPHCEDEIIVKKNELNCKIFRHAIYTHNYEQVNPHLSKNECEKLINEQKVYGCCKPFEIINKNNKFYATICEYK